MKLITLLVASAILAFAAPADARAASWNPCSIGDSGVSYDRYGDAAAFERLSARSGMNCASARYVLNKWLRRSFVRRGSFPTRFYDGYVTWYCHKRTALRWQCDEYDSYTAFRFTAYYL